MVQYSLVVGGAGFIGSHLVDKLMDMGAEKVVVVDNFFLGVMDNLQKTDRLVVYREDARYLMALENVLSRENVDVVFNLAVKPLPYTFIDPEGAFMTGVEITHNLVSLLRRGLFKKLIHFSSSEVYGDAVYVPMDEDHPLRPINPYGAGKASADLLLESYNKMFNLNIVIVRPFNTYGPRQNSNTYAAIIPSTIRRILGGQKPVIEWDGEQTRDFTYVEDIVSAACKLMNTDDAIGKSINVGQGKEVSVKDVISEICQALSYTGEIEYAPKRPVDIKRHLASVVRAKELIDYQPKISFREGIKRTTEWFGSSK